MLLDNLNKEQMEAVTHGNGPLLIVAGAGTGKTTVITRRIAWLIDQGLAKSDEILALTFTDKAAGEMEERVDRLLPYGYVDLWISTFHGFCDRILKAHGLDIGVPNNYKLLNQTEQWMLVRQNLEKFNLDYYRPLGNPAKFIHALIGHFSRCKDEVIGPGDYLKYAEDLKINLDGMESGVEIKKLRNKEIKRKEIGNDDVDISEIRRLEEVANAYHVYQQLLLDNDSMDFGDLINYTLKLFRERPNILKKYQEQFKYVLVDEFQDTNWAQYELIKLLAGEEKNITTVLDDDQAIYAWRGASYNNAIQFQKDFAGLKQVSLVNNYRSTQDILDTAYKFIQINNPERLEAQSDGLISKNLKSQLGEKGVIEHIHVDTEADEARAVVGKMLKIYNGGELTWNDFAILVRANSQAEPFLSALQSADIPFNFVASKGLYAKEVVMDILAYLKLLDNYHESLAFWRVLNFPMMNIKIEDLMEMTKFAYKKTCSLYETARQINLIGNIDTETRRKVEKILDLVSKHTKLAREKSAKQVVLKFLEDFNYNKYLLDNNDSKAFIYINHLGKKIDEFEKSFDDKSVKNFMGIIDLEMESGEQGSLSKELQEGPEAVKVMTIHSAKGLEFEHVFVVNMVDKRFPSINRSDPIELPEALVKEIIPEGDIHLQEERRLFYVAMTRAKRGLYFTSAEDYGGSRQKKLSRFIYEIGLENTEYGIKNKEKISNIQYPISNIKVTGDGKVIVQDKLQKQFSYSQIKAYETCPYQYYLGFVLQIPTLGRATFSYGKTMHSTLQKFFGMIRENGKSAQGDLFVKTLKHESIKTLKQNNLPSLHDLLEIYKSSWIDEWYETKEDKEKYRKQGEKSLKGIYEQVQENTPKVLDLEKGFNFKIDQYTIRGVVDRVDDLGGGKVEIIDYKTGSAKTEKTIEKDQLLIYQIAARETFGYDVERLTFYYLNNNSEVSFLGKEKEIEKIKNKVFELIGGIVEANFEATPSSFKCEWCDFKNICSYRE